MRTLIIAMIMVSMASMAIADDTTPSQTIKQINTGWERANIYIQTEEMDIVEGCSSSRLKVDSTHPMFKEILSIALTAYTSKIKVAFRVSGCDGNDMNVIAIGMKNP